MANLSRHIALFIGQKKPKIAIPADQALLLQAGQAFLNLPLQTQLVSINLVDAQGGEVVDVGFDNVRYVPNQKHRLQQQTVVG